jgi:hypothetical protein
MSHVIDTRRLGGDLVILGSTMVLPSVIPSPLLLTEPTPHEGSLRYNPVDQTVEYFVDDWYALANNGEVQNALNHINSHLFAIDEILTDLQTQFANSIQTILDYINEQATGGNSSLLSLTAAIIAEQTRAQGAESALGVRIDNLTSNVNSMNTTLIATAEGLQTEITDRENAISSLRDELMGMISNSTTAQPYDLCFEALNKVFDAGEIVGIFEFPRTVTFEANFGGSRGFTNYTANQNTTITIYKNLEVVGGVLFHAGMADAEFFTESSFSNGVTYNAGDQIMLMGPDPADPTLSNITVTLAGTR